MMKLKTNKNFTKGKKIEIRNKKKKLRFEVEITTTKITKL